MILTRNIVPGLSVASLMGIRVLCKAGCKVIFTDTKCEVKYKNKVILNGIKDPTTDLWTLPITPMAINEMGSHELGKDPCDQKNPHPGNWAAFTHSIRTRANAVKFSHQSLCSPTISSLMKASKKGFLKGCSDLSEDLVTTLIPRLQQLAGTSIPRSPIAHANPPILPLFNEAPPYHGPAYNVTIGPNIIADDEFIANVFCFGAFAEKITGVVYNDLTENFPFMSLDGSLCFLSCITTRQTQYWPCPLPI